MPSNRPTSPHLTIYRKQITSVLSILHRLTGVALYFGSMLLVAWLWSAAYSPETYTKLHECMMSGIGQALMFGWVFAFYFHLNNGIRHLYWDAGIGFTIPQVTRSGWVVVLFTFIMTLFTWGYVHSAGV